MNSSIKIDKKSIEDIYGLTSLQEGMLFYYLLNKEEHIYYVQLSLDLKGIVNLDVLNWAWQSVIENNELLRTVFRWDKLSKPVQIVVKNINCDICFVDLSKFDFNQKGEKLNELLEKIYNEDINLDQNPIKLTLCKLEELNFKLIIKTHHIIYDGWSNSIIISELINNYEKLIKREKINKLNKSKFKEFVKINTFIPSSDLDYWKKYLSEYSDFKIIQTKNRLCDDNSFESKSISITPANVNKLRNICEKKNLTIADILYISWGILLYKYSGKSDILFGTTISGRNVKLIGIENIVGLFINTIPLRIKLLPNKCIFDTIKYISAQIRERAEYENVPLKSILEVSGLKGAEIFESIFVVENYPLSKRNINDELYISSFSIKESTNYKLTVSAIISDEIEIKFSYSLKYFENTTIENVAKHLNKIINYVINEDDTIIEKLSLSSNSEINQLLYEFNKTQKDYPKSKTIHQLFEEQVSKTPDKVSVSFNGAVVTYSELNKKANQLASYLTTKGYCNGMLIGIILERSVEMLIGILGVLKSGCAYLPFDTEHPRERNEKIIKSSEIEVILTNVPNLDLKVNVIVNLGNREIFNKETIHNNIHCQSDDLAYVMYTSGSTGNPKGVMVEHRNVVNLLYGMKNVYTMQEGTSLLSLTTITFDIFGVEIFLPLCSGTYVIIGDAEDLRDARRINHILKRNKVFLLQLTPSRLKLILSTTEEPELLGRVSTLVLAGEELPFTLLEEAKRVFKGKIYNMYGPTETTIYSTFKDVTENVAINIGKPIINTQVRILGTGDSLQPIGIAGELCILGDGVARGYYKNAALTQEKFIEIIDADGERAKMYRTGDLAQWTPEGEIDFLGRIDNQVKIRGFRIELGEVENAIRQNKSIKECVVQSGEQNGEKFLCAYFVPSIQQTELSQQLRTHLSEILPDYMIPSFFVELDQLPLTPSGKIDRRNLPVTEFTSSRNYLPPSNDFERKLVQLWSEVLVLDADKISVNASFFDLGGHSLRATQLVSRIHKQFDVRLELKEIFQNNTVLRLARKIRDFKKEDYQSIPISEEKEYYELSSAQRRLYLLQQMDIQSIAYNMPGEILLPKDYSKVHVEDCFRSLIKRHESLRTSFGIVSDKLVQYVHKDVPFIVLEYSADKEKSVKLRKEFVRPFNLSEAPMIRAAILKVNGLQPVLLVDMHHIVGDGISHTILNHDLKQLMGFQELKPLHLQYRDYSEWQNGKNHPMHIKEQEEYWLRQFDGEIPVLDIPLDYQRPVFQSFEGAEVTFSLNERETHTLNAIVRQSEVTLYMIILATYEVLLSKLSGQEDIVVGSPVAARRRREFEGVVGMFVNTLALRGNVSGEKRFMDFLKEVRENTLKAYDNQEYQFEELVEKVVRKRDAGRNPLFDVMFNLQNQSNEAIELSNFNKEENKHTSGLAKFDLTLSVIEYTGRLMLTMNYCTKLFNASTIDRYIGYFKMIVNQITNTVDKKISDIEIISQEEKQSLLSGLNNTEVDYPKDKTVHDLFKTQAKRSAESIAIKLKNQAITYSELDKRTDKLAYQIREQGVKPDDVIGLLMDRSIETIIGMLSILKAGGAYLPIDVSYPKERIEYLIKDSGTKLVLTSNNQLDNVFDQVRILFVEDLEKTTRANVVLENINSPSDLCYVIYTSGTTGNPKGVMVEHRNVVRLFFNEQFQFDFDSSDTWTMFHSHCFDFSVWEIYGALLFGGKLILVPKLVAVDTLEYLKILREESVTILNQTPSAFYNLLREEQLSHNVSLNLRYVIFGGEALSPAKLEVWRNRYPSVKLINMFGITETTVHVTYKEIGEYEISNNISSVGKPIPTLSVYILDKNQKLLPNGVTGEIYVGGAGVARGYLGKNELTRERFIQNPYNPEERLYRSGDLGRVIGSGDIEYLGRIDHQVQLRGFRVELGEIESKLISHDKIMEAVVIAKEKEDDKYLIAYYVSLEEIDVFEIRNFLSSKMPEYMVPSYYVRLDRLPLTSNGKLDKKGLPDPEIKIGDDFVAPSNEIEEKLVEIWSEVLKLDKRLISINRSFFDLGGHSLKATQLISRIHKQFGLRLGIKEIFQSSTVMSLVEVLKRARKEGYHSIPTSELKDYNELSSAQRRLYLLQQMDTESIAYNIPGEMLLPENYSREVVESFFRSLVDRHESLRTIFKVIGDRPVQCILRDITFVVQEYSIGKDELSKARREFVRPFNLHEAPLFRASILNVIGSQPILLVDMHHIISDGVSHSILEQDLKQLMNGYELKPLRLQYRDYSEWQNGNIQRSRVKEHEEFWLKQFEGEIPVLEIPNDYQRFIHQNFDGAEVMFSLTEYESSILQTVAMQNEATLYMVMLTVYYILLYKLSGQEDLVVGTPIAARYHVELKDVVGMFVNTLAMRNRISGEKCFNEFLKEVKENTLKAYDNQEYQFEELVEKVVKERDAGRNPLFDVMFNLQNQASNKSNHQYLNKKENTHTNGVAKFDLTLSAVEDNGRLRLTMNYSTRLFKSSTIDRYIGYFKRIVSQLATKVADKISDIEIISDKEITKLLYEFNNTKVDFQRNKSIKQLFEEQVERTPDNIAVVFNGEKLSYYDLNQKANQIADIIKFRQLSNEIIGLRIEPSLSIVIGIIGIIKAGSAFLPIDINQTINRTLDIINDSESKLLITQRKFKDEIKFNGEVLIIEDELKINTTLENPSNGNSDLLYVIYTSGSTGKPKGVQISNRNIANYYSWFSKFANITSEDKTLIANSFAFDITYTQFFSLILNGGEQHVISRESYMYAPFLINYITQYKITLLKLTPTLFNMIVNNSDFTNKIWSDLRLLVFGGEPIIANDIKKLFKLLPQVKIINHYGPTETTIGTIAKYFTDVNNNDSWTAIGKPISNAKAYILGKQLEILPFGVSGELYIGGEGVGIGYLNRVELTNERFIDSPFNSAEKLYKTGDLSRRLPDGTIEFLGRVDHQIKIRGYRIELGEIESTLKRHNKIRNSAVIDFSENNEKYLCAYFTAEKEIDTNEIRNYLSDKLPDYMIPSYFIQLNEIPLTSNGKINRKVLPRPEVKIGEDYVAPSNDIERRLIEIWSEVLNLSPSVIGVNSNFFYLGGHSLKAMALIMKLNREFNVKIKLTEIFNQPTVKGIINVIQSTIKQAYKTIYRAEKKEYYELSSAQKRIFVIHKMNGLTSIFNVPISFVLKGKLNVDALENAFKRIIERHEVLRTSFDLANGKIVQKVYDRIEFKLEYVQSNKQEIDHKIETFIRPFDLSKPPLFRVLLIEIREDYCVLVFDIHHIISDGVTSQIIAKECLSLYDHFIIEEPPFQYKDYSEWQNSSYYKELIKKQEVFWMNEYKTLPPLIDLPADFKRGEINKYQGCNIEWLFDQELTRKIHELNLKSETTVFMFLLSVYYLVIYKYTNIKDVVIGFPVTGRNEQSFANTLGMFVNMMPIRNKIDETKQYSYFLNEVKKSVLNVLENQDFQFDELVNKLGITGVLDRNPLFNVVLAMQNMEQTARKNSHFELTRNNISNSHAKFDLTLSVSEQNGELLMYLEYSTQLFKKTRIEQFQIHFTEIITQVIEADIIIDEIQLSGISPKIKSKDIAVDTVDFNF